jgi:hypothetical protein
LATFIGRALNLVGSTFILSTGSSKAYQLMARGANARVQGCQARRDRDLVSANFVSLTMVASAHLLHAAS